MTMDRVVTTRDDLEAALRARPDEGTLSVYADLLQAQGDPRGELIALDMRGVGDYKRRGQLLTAWLGDEVSLAWSAQRELWYAGDLEGTHATFDNGFVDLLVLEPDYPPLFVANLIDGPAGPYLHMLCTRGSPALLAHVALRTRPWLKHLVIDRSPDQREPFTRELLDKLVTATPNLEVLEVAGRAMLGDFAHPNVRELAVNGAEALDLVDGPPLSCVHTLDFKFDGDRPTANMLISPSRFPKLRRVSFEREEPGGVRLFERLGTLGVGEQITHLVLPSLRTPDQVELVQAAIDRMPMLREVKIARAYACHPQPQLRHATARVLLAEPFPWPPRETLDPNRVIVVDGCPADLEELIDALESQYGDLSTEHQATWYRFFQRLYALEESPVRLGPTEHAFAALDLSRALDNLRLGAHNEELRAHLHDRIARRSAFLAAIHWTTI